MRFLFGFLAIASCVALGCSESKPKPSPAATAPTAPADTTPPAPSQVTYNSPVDITGMKEMSDWQKLEALAKTLEGIENIQLAAQNEAGKINEPRAYLRYTDKLNKEEFKTKAKELGYDINIKQQ